MKEHIIAKDLSLYMRAHLHPVNQWLHYFAFLSAFIAWIFVFIDIKATIVLAVLHYVLSWVGHFYFERNKPASFKYPWLGFYAGFIWFFIRTYELLTRREVLKQIEKSQASRRVTDMKTIYLIRHCKALGQESEADLTAEGEEQSYAVADFLKNRNIDFIVSSPFLRAVKTIQPLADELKLKINTDARLSERLLSAAPLPDWLDRLQDSFIDEDLKLEGGESSAEAAARGLEVIEELLQSKSNRMAVVSHGNLLSLIIRNYNKSFGFADWKQMSNPDIFELTVEGQEHEIKRIWEQT